MRTLLFSFISLWISAPVWANECTKEEVCSLAKKMNPFSVLDKCPMAAPIIRQCKNTDQKKVKDLPSAPEFVDKGDGTILDKANQLLWSKTELDQKAYPYKEAAQVANAADIGGKFGWRLPTLPELKSLMTNERKKSSGGKRSYIHPIFNDGDQWNKYWTTTTCNEVTIYTDERFGSKKCQEGESGAWFVHFKLGTLSWSFKKAKNWVWVVMDLKNMKQ